MLKKDQPSLYSLYFSCLFSFCECFTNCLHSLGLASAGLGYRNNIIFIELQTSCFCLPENTTNIFSEKSNMYQSILVVKLQFIQRLRMQIDIMITQISVQIFEYLYFCILFLPQLCKDVFVKHNEVQFKFCQHR